ncbi:MAG: winged helix-turn-helix domain-containing protein [Gammaproteobacteria bacterium]
MAVALHIDLVNQRLWRDGQEIKLTPKVFALLRYFVERPEQLITKDDLFNALWSNRYVNEELVRDYVRDLRKALGDDSEAPRYIETLRRRGYRYLGGITVGKRSPAPSPRPAAVEANMAFPLPDKPSLAVLPFDNLSRDAAQEIVADGLTEAIITTLARNPKLFVIARHSTFYYKGKAVTVKQVAEQLGVRYVLEGSLRRSGERMRVTAQLIDALTGHHLWAEEYDRRVQDLFEMEDDITWRIATEMEVKLTRGEDARIWRGKTHNIEAYQCLLRAIDLLEICAELSSEQGRRLLEKAVALDPAFASAWVWLGFAHLNQARFGWAKDRDEGYARAEQCAQQALRIDEKYAVGHSLLGCIHIFRGEPDKGLALVKQAAALDPQVEILEDLASHLAFLGDPQEALAMVQETMRPIPTTLLGI